MINLKYEHLEGRRFTGIGKVDCFDMCIHFFKDNFGIELQNLVRPHDWKSDELDLITMGYERLGFQQITFWKPKDLRPADVLAVPIGERNPNHLAIYLGDGKVLHHLYGRISKAEDMRDFWFNQTSYILRHPDVPEMQEEKKDVTIMELLRARNTPPAPRQD